MAERIDGAQFVELEGDDHLMWVGDIEPLCQAIESFLGGRSDPRAGQHRTTAARQ
jgi:hypothetical protein